MYDTHTSRSLSFQITFWSSRHTDNSVYEDMQPRIWGQDNAIAKKHVQSFACALFQSQPFCQPQLTIRVNTCNKRIEEHHLVAMVELHRLAYKSMSIRSFPYASVPQLSLSRLYRVFLGIYHPFVVLVTFCLSRRLTLPHSRLATSRSPHLLNSPLNSSKNFAHREDQLGFILQTQRSPLSKTKNRTLVIGHSVFSKTL